MSVWHHLNRRQLLKENEFFCCGQIPLLVWRSARLIISQCFKGAVGLIIAVRIVGLSHLLKTSDVWHVKRAAPGFLVHIFWLHLKCSQTFQYVTRVKINRIFRPGWSTAETASQQCLDFYPFPASCRGDLCIDLVYNQDSVAVLGENNNWGGKHFSLIPKCSSSFSGFKAETTQRFSLPAHI